MAGPAGIGYARPMLVLTEIVLFAGLVATYALSYRLSYAGEHGQRYYLHAIAVMGLTVLVLLWVVLGRPDGGWLGAAMAYAAFLLAACAAGWTLLIRALARR